MATATAPPKPKGAQQRLRQPRTTRHEPRPAQHRAQRLTQLALLPLVPLQAPQARLSPQERLAPQRQLALQQRLSPRQRLYPCLCRRLYLRLLPFSTVFWPIMRASPRKISTDSFCGTFRAAPLIWQAATCPAPIPKLSADVSLTWTAAIPVVSPPKARSCFRPAFLIA